jgi:hypothetical protein
VPTCCCVLEQDVWGIHLGHTNGQDKSPASVETTRGDDSQWTHIITLDLSHLNLPVNEIRGGSGIFVRMPGPNLKR